jgi:hypothetical protein
MFPNRTLIEPTASNSRCYRLTANGRACVQIVESGEMTVGSLSHYLHDVLLLCGSGAWFDQLREFVPPRSLEDSLRSLLALGLVECVEQPQPQRGTATPAWTSRPFTAFGQMTWV